MAMHYVVPPMGRAAHSGWTDLEIRHLRFVRWAVDRRRISDGLDDVDGCARITTDEPRTWSVMTVMRFESRANDDAYKAMSI